MTPVEVAVEFLGAINSRDPDKIAALMTQDHIFVDSLGHAFQGRVHLVGDGVENRGLLKGPEKAENTLRRNFHQHR